MAISDQRSALRDARPGSQPAPAAQAHGDAQPAVSVSRSLLQAAQTLSAAGSDTPRLDAEVLLAHALGQDRAWLYAHPEYALGPDQLGVYQALIARRAEREPVAYLTGHKEFFGLDFVVTLGVLIPRPETERLVEIALQILKAGARPDAVTIADVGTGSGAIAIALAIHVRAAHVLATDVSAAAVAVARHNAVRHGVAGRVDCLQGDLLAPLRGAFHLIAANLPYLSRADLAAAPPEVAHWEPRLALEGGPDGLAAIRRMLASAANRLHPAGALLAEIGAGQGADALALADQHFPRAMVEIAQDHAGLDRVLVVRLRR
jgi:release factor glutamine methyltransferase